MAEFVIFNPNRGYNAALGFNPNWNYGGPRKPGANYTTVRPRFGRWQTRSVGDAGYSFDMVFVDRPIQQVWYIKRFYEQYQTGFFTVIDYDNEGRNHVGRFTSYADDTHTANLKFTIRVTFEEIPGCPMQQYPQNWFHESHAIYPVDGWINTQGTPNLLLATSGSSWIAQQTPQAVALGLSASDPSSYEAFEAVAMAGDFAQVEYTGWGWRMGFRTAPTLGLFNLLMDGTQMLSEVDLSGAIDNVAGIIGNSPNPAVIANLAPNAVLWLSMPSTPLGRHRVKIVAVGADGPGNGGDGIIFPAIEVMH